MGAQAGHHWQNAAAAVAAAAILIVPLWCVNAPAMPDYPAHLASFYLISGGVRVPALAHIYQLEWAFIPNLAAEVLVPLLGRLMSLAAATKLFLSAAVAMWVLGPALIQRALYGRIGPAALAGASFAYNANFMWGFLNYYFAAGLCLCLFGAWISSERRFAPWRLLAFAIAATVVYFCHIFAAALLLLLLGTYELGCLIERRSLSWASAWSGAAAIGAIFVPSALAFLFLKPAGADHQGLKFDFLTTWLDRIDSILQSYFDKPDYVLLAALALLLAIGIWRKKVSFHPRMYLLLGVLGVATLLAPEWAMGGWGVELRLPAVFCLLLFAAAEIKLDTRALAAMSAAIFAVLIYNSATLAGNWRYYDRRFDEFRAALPNIPLGARIVTVLDGDAIGEASDQPYWHMAEFAIIDRDAFTPLMFTTKGQHVVRLQSAYQNIAAETANQGSPPDISELDDLSAGQIDGDKDIRDVFPYLMYFQCHFDDVILVHLNGTRSPVPGLLHLRHAGSFFAIYAVAPNEACAKR